MTKESTTNVTYPRGNNDEMVGVPLDKRIRRILRDAISYTLRNPKKGTFDPTEFLSLTTTSLRGDTGLDIFLKDANGKLWKVYLNIQKADVISPPKRQWKIVSNVLTDSDEEPLESEGAFNTFKEASEFAEVLAQQFPKCIVHVKEVLV